MITPGLINLLEEIINSQQLITAKQKRVKFLPSTTECRECSAERSASAKFHTFSPSFILERKSHLN
jgi:hypothetical protein